MLKVFRYRLYPTKAQQTRINATLESLRWVFNETLAARKNTWEKEKKNISLFQTNKLLTQWKKEHPELNHVYSQVLQDAQVRVDLAFKAFFRRVKAGEEKVGYPRFKGRNRYDSLTYTQFGFKLKGDRLTLAKIGDLRVKLHRPLEGRIKCLALRRTSTGKMFVSFTTEVQNKPATFKDGSVVGVDVGLESFATLSNGEKIENPRFFRNEEKALARSQRRLSKEKEGSIKWYKHLKVIRRIHERISNKRLNFIHQESRKLVNRFGIIAFEDLNVKEMEQNHRLAKSIADASWSMFVNATKSKAEDAGSKVVLVNPVNTSQICSRCGMIVEKELSDRTHTCQCGLSIDRDLNASINILRLGLQSLGMKEAIEARPL
ncbi:MAG: IS200/IS605 family element transposase accessory protein TnpB [Candidatus Verstraetearchaeota archaeon]|nr:IS200/IS605 family element transposase accessory protein TnpB [Candidatus Verstraetearchaeota archaeon]